MHLRLEQLLTGKDNETLEPGRVYTFVGFITAHFLAGLMIYKGIPLTFTEWCIGMGLFITGGATASALSASSQPDPSLSATGEQL